MDSTQDIKRRLEILKVRLQKRYPITSMAIFGSYARNEQIEGSDLDIVVEFNGRIGSNFMVLADEIEDYLGLKVELVSKNGIKPRYFKTIESDLIYI